MNSEFENKAAADHIQHKPLVSIGMPVYNGAKFIHEALDSLLAQTFTDFELIISDNASTDETEAICREYAAKDKRIRYIRQHENRGAAANFQFVLDEAVGEYFMWAAADDILDSDFILKCITILQKSEIDGVFTKYCVQSRLYPILKMKNFPHLDFLSNPGPYIRLSRFILLSELSHKANIIYGLWRKNVLVKMQSAFKNIDNRFVYLGLDMAMLVYVLTHSRLCQYPEILFLKRYKRFPPGHITSLIFDTFIRIFRGKQRNKENEENITLHYKLLQKSLELANIYNPKYKEILETKRTLDLQSFCNPRTLLLMIYNSIKYGVI